MNRLPAAILALLLIAGAAARGQTKVLIPAAADAPIENVFQVAAPSAHRAVVSDHLGLLVFSHHPKYTAAQLTLFRLDPQTGKPNEPLLLKLPKPAGLGKYPNYVTGLAFHPKLPLLYVWQDIEFPKAKDGYPAQVPLPLSAADAQAMAEFDHLLIYRLEKPQPELMVGLARGAKFAYSRPAGSLAVDQTGERLYVPNLATNSKAQTTVGSYVLYADGLPVIGELPEGKTLVADRLAHLAAINAAKSALPQRIAPAGGYHFYSDRAVGSGIGFVPVGRDIVLMGAFHNTGLLSWTPDNRQCRMQSYGLHTGNYAYRLPAGHPTLPLVFVSELNSPYLYRFEHADGNLTLVPQRAELQGATLTGAPVVTAKGTKVAVGGRHRLYLLHLNEKGKFKPERQQTVIGDPQVEALAYSDKFDRLYVGVEKKK